MHAGRSDVMLVTVHVGRPFRVVAVFEERTQAANPVRAISAPKSRRIALPLRLSAAVTFQSTATLRIPMGSRYGAS